jgi:hypothetical protein
MARAKSASKFVLFVFLILASGKTEAEIYLGGGAKAGEVCFSRCIQSTRKFAERFSFYLCETL